MKWLTARPGAPKLSITIENPKPIYTTWDRVEGTVTVTTHDETDFNNIKITFEGILFVQSLNYCPNSI